MYFLSFFVYTSVVLSLINSYSESSWCKPIKAPCTLLMPFFVGHMCVHKKSISLTRKRQEGCIKISDTYYLIALWCMCFLLLVGNVAIISRLWLEIRITLKMLLYDRFIYSNWKVWSIANINSKKIFLPFTSNTNNMFYFLHQFFTYISLA